MNALTRRLTALALPLSVALTLGTAHATTNLEVDDDGGTCAGAAFTTIQDAIDFGVSLNDDIRILVCPGTYPENIVISNAPRAIRIDGWTALRVFLTGVPGTAGPVLRAVNSAPLLLKGVTVNPNSLMEPDTANGIVTGVEMVNTSGTLRDMWIFNVRNQSSTARGIAINMESTNAGPHSTLVFNVRVENFTRTGVRANGTGLTTSVAFTRLVGPTNPTTHAPSGVQISRGTRGYVAFNTVTGMASPFPNSGAGTAILGLCAAERTVFGNNTVSNSDLGIVFADSNRGTIRDNIINTPIFDGVSLQVIGEFFGPRGCPNPPNMNNNEVLGNRITAPAGNGISMVSFDPSSTIVPTNTVIDGNTIMDAGQLGMLFVHGTTGTVRNNEISNSAGFDIQDATTGGGTMGTGAVYTNNSCLTSDPAGLCAQAPPANP